MSENNGNGYWGGYPSYLLKERRQDESRSSRPVDLLDDRSSSDDLFANYPGEQPFGSPSSYWGSQEVMFERLRSSSPQGRSNSASAPNQDYLKYGYGAKSHIVAGLLAIFLGCFGIHKFYLGYNSIGIVMLAVTVMGSVVSFGLAGMVMTVVGIVEGIIYLVVGQASFDRIYVLNRKEWF